MHGSVPWHCSPDRFGCSDQPDPLRGTFVRRRSSFSVELDSCSCGEFDRSGSYIVEQLAQNWILCIYIVFRCVGRVVDRLFGKIGVALWTLLLVIPTWHSQMEG